MYFDVAVEELGETPRRRTYGCIARVLLDQRLAAEQSTETV